MTRYRAGAREAHEHEAHVNAAHAAGSSRHTLVERSLLALGADPCFLDGVFGDLAEEYAHRVSSDGRLAATAWRARELIRSAPHLVGSALRHGGPRAYLRLAALIAILALTLAVVLVAVRSRYGVAVSIDAGPAFAADGIVVNNARPVQLEMRVLNRAGYRLDADSVRFAWRSGAPLSITARGVLTCTERGDARVRATLGAIFTDVDVHCRPVQELRAATWIDFVAGDSTPRHLPFEAIGLDGQRVTELRGATHLSNPAIATLDGATVRARQEGATMVRVEVGEQEARMMLVVHALVPSFESLRDDQRFVARPVRLARGDTLHWQLPNGSYWLKYIPRRAGEAPPTITVAGAIGCMPGDGIRAYRLPVGIYGAYCLVQRDGSARVMLAHGESGAEWVEGTVAIQRMELR
ncbi:MAG: hypothetical protein IT359_19615 [Gemmatimonadaceae bacterium]|nr:hypothetical protein [Gemmatimonadaceae bacterium]